MTGPQPVISATHTIGDGLVVRWRRTAEGETVVSASRSAVMIHGTVTVDDDTLRQWIADAEHARELLRSGRTAEARALATHEYDRGSLVPVKCAKAEP